MPQDRQYTFKGGRGEKEVKKGERKRLSGSGSKVSVLVRLPDKKRLLQSFMESLWTSTGALRLDVFVSEACMVFAGFKLYIYLAIYFQGRSEYILSHDSLVPLRR